MAHPAFTITRTFDAPRALVFEGFTKREHLERWWGPKGFAMIASRLDLRPGGQFHYGMRAPDGTVMWGRWVFEEVAAPERIVFINAFSDEHGGLTRHPLHSRWPLEMLNTITFEESQDRTTVTLSGAPIRATEEERHLFEASFDSMANGFGGSLDQLTAFLAEQAEQAEAPRAFRFERTYDAPVGLVYQAWTQPEHFAMWWGLDGFTTRVLSMDVRPGGMSRYLMIGPDGTEYPTRVDYLEVEPEHHLLYLLGEDTPAGNANPFRARVSFESRGETTHVIMRVVVSTVEAFEVATGFGAFELGMQNLARLDDHLLSMVLR